MQHGTRCGRMTPRLLGILAATVLVSMPAHGASGTAPSGACGPVQYVPLPTPLPFTTQSIRFQADARVTLGGCLYRPLGSARFPVLVMVTGSGDEPSAADYYTVMHAQALAAKGVRVFG